MRAGAVVLILASGMFCFPEGLARGADESPPEWSARMSAFLEGRFDDVISAGADAEPDYRLLCLKARAHEHKYGHYYLAHIHPGKYTPEEESRLGMLCVAANAAYRDAYVAAPDDYERSRVLASWWSFSLRLKYSGDPSFLRDRIAAMTRSTARGDPADLAVLRNVFRGLLDAAPGTQGAPAVARDAFAEAFVDEYTSFCGIAVPPHRFQAVLRSLPLFVTDYMALETCATGEVVRNTLRWHLWNGLTCVLPEEAERERIDEQIGEFVREIEQTFDAILQHPKLKSVGGEYAQRFRMMYGLCKDNVLIPGFKRAHMPYEMARIRPMLEESLAQFKESWRRRMQRLDDMPAEKASPQGYRDAQDLYARQLYGLMLRWFLFFEEPITRGQIPGERVELSSGSLNTRWLWSFSVQRTELMVPPAKTQAAPSGP